MAANVAYHLSVITVTPTLLFSKTCVVGLLIHSILRGKNCTSAPARVQFFQRKIERTSSPTIHVLLWSLGALWKELLHRAHDVMTVICDAPANWWQVKAVGRVDLKRVYFQYDSRHVHFGSRWLDEMVRSGVNKLCGITEKCLHFNANCIVRSQQKYLTVSVKAMETTKLPVPHFLSISCK